jgi:hypothetical protein
MYRKFTGLRRFSIFSYKIVHIHRVKTAQSTGTRPFYEYYTKTYIKVPLTPSSLLRFSAKSSKNSRK